MPTPQEARSRQTAYLAERHWWTQKLEVLAEDYRQSADAPPLLPDIDPTLKLVASHIDALIAERNPR